MKRQTSTVSKRNAHNAHSVIKERFASQHAGYVLITCNNPTPDGRMQIEMSYEGDAALAAYMLLDAQSVIDEEVDELL